MKTFVSYKFLKSAALLLALSGLTASAENPATNAATKIAPPALIKSVFLAETGSGKDPFFPASKRRIEVIEQPAIPSTVPQQSLLFNQLALKGISGSKGQRLALINSSTIGVGERAEIRCGPQWLKVRCLEIRDRSVLIELDGLGETKELKLRDGV